MGACAPDWIPAYAGNDGVGRAMRYNARAMEWSDEVVKSMRAREVRHAAYAPDATNRSVLAKLGAGRRSPSSPQRGRRSRA